MCAEGRKYHRWRGSTGGRAQGFWRLRAAPHCGGTRVATDCNVTRRGSSNGRRPEEATHPLLEGLGTFRSTRYHYGWQAYVDGFDAAWRATFGRAEAPSERRAEDAVLPHDEATDVEDQGVLRRRVDIGSTLCLASGFFERGGVSPLGDRLLAGALKRRCVAEGRHRRWAPPSARATHSHHAPRGRGNHPETVPHGLKQACLPFAFAARALGVWLVGRCCSGAPTLTPLSDEWQGRGGR